MPKKVLRRPETAGIFKYMKMLVLPSLIAPKRLALFETQVTKASGRWLPVTDVRGGDKPTHIVIDESLAKDPTKVRQMLEEVDLCFSAENIIVTTKWLSSCLKNSSLEPVDDYKVSLNSAGTQRKTVKEQTELDAGGSESVENRKRDRSYLTPSEASSGTSSSTGNCDRDIAVQGEERPESTITVDRCSEDDLVAAKRPKVDVIVPSSSKKSRNDLIIAELQKLADAFQSKGDTWRAHGYTKAVSAIRRHSEPINSYEDALQLPGIGARMAEKVWEILECGSLRKVAEICGDEKTSILELFTGIWGAGPSTAESWYRQGYRSLEDLKQNATLTKQQQVGLKHYDEFADRMTREEVETIASEVRDAARAVEPSVEIFIVGSYRRGKTSCGDVDVMIIRPDYIEPGHILPRVLEILRGKNFITDDLVHIEEQKNQRKYLGVCRLKGEHQKHRRLDIFVAPRSEFAPALMHYTGSALFNRTIRLAAARKGMSLSEHALTTNVIRQGSTIINDGQSVPTPTEKSIFESLGMDYLEPHERNH